MNVGDLVNFEARAWVFAGANKDYVNPGVVLSKKKNPIIDGRYTFEIYWADGKITNEHDSYVHPAGDDSVDR